MDIHDAIDHPESFIDDADIQKDLDLVENIILTLSQTDEVISDSSEAEHERTMSTSTVSNCADSGISMCSDTRDDPSDGSDFRDSPKNSKLRKPKFSLDVIRRSKRIAFRSNSNQRRSRSLPDILDIEIYGGKATGIDSSEIDASSENDISKEHGVQRASLQPLPVCGKEHAEDPCYICIKDNEIYCKRCVQLHNFHCKENVKYIPEIPPEVKESLCNDVIRELKSLRVRFERIKKENLNNLQQLTESKTSYVRSVMAFKNNIQQILDIIEKDALNEMEVVFAKESESIENNLKRLESEILNIDRHLNDIDNRKTDEGNSIIYRLQNATKETVCYDSLVRDVHKGSNTVDLSFELNESFKNFLNEADNLWEFARKETNRCSFPKSCTCDKPYTYRTAEKLRDVSVRLSGWSFDQKKCSITGCDFLPSGKLLLSDNNNKKVKLFDKKFKCISAQSTPSLPWDVAVVNEDLAVVTIPDKKQLQFMGTSSRLSLKHAVTLAKNCWGVKCANEELYVTCWSRDSSEVLITDLEGNTKRQIKTLQDHSFHTPWFLTAFNSTIYVSDWGLNSVPCFTACNALVKMYQDRQLAGAFGITSDPDGNVYICGRDTNNVHQLSPDGELQQLLLTEKDGIHQPLNVAHCRANDRFVVTQWMSDKIQVFSLQ